MGNFEAEKQPSQEMAWGRYTESDSLRVLAECYSVDADWGVLDGVQIGATWRI